MQPLNVFDETADLSVTSTSLDEDNGRVRLSWTVENIGINTSNARYWRDDVIVSRNDTFGDDDDIFLKSVYHSGALSPGGTYSVDQTFDIPYSLNEPLNFFVSVDRRNEVRESGQLAKDSAAGLEDRLAAHVFTDDMDQAARDVALAQSCNAGSEVK